MISPDELRELRSRQWSCSTLSRGISYLDDQRQQVKQETMDIDEQLKAAQQLRERLEIQLEQTQAKEKELEKEKESENAVTSVALMHSEAVTAEGGGDKPVETQPADLPTHEVPVLSMAESFEPEYPDNQQGLYPESQHCLDDESSRPVSTPVRAKTRALARETPEQKSYMRSRDVREPLTPTELESPSPLRVDDYLVPTPSPQGADSLQEYFTSLASAMSSVGIGDEAGKVEPEPAQAPAELPVPPPVVPTEPPAVPTEPPSTPAPKVVVPAAAPVQSGGTPGDAVMETPGGSTGPGEPSNSDARSVKLIGGKNKREISDKAAEQAIRRLCKVGKRGQRKVSKEICSAFLDGGAGRKELIKLFIDCNGNHDMFKRSADMRIQQRRQRKEHQGGGYYTEEAMKTELKYSSKRVKAIMTYCEDKKRRATHVRKDKYENISKYLVETEDTVEYNREHNELVEHRLEFEVSGPSSAAFPTVPEGLGPISESSRPSNPVTADAEESDDSDDGMMAEETSDSSDEDGDAKSKATSKSVSKGASQSVKRKSSSANGEAKKTKTDRHVDEIPEDIYNTDEVLSQILKSSVKMDGLLDKLSKLETTEAAEMVKSIENQKKTLFTLHDEIATFKAEYDADKEISPEKAKTLRAKFRQVEVACSRAAMEHKKLTRTILKKQPEAKPKPKAGSKAKSKPAKKDHTYEEGEEEEEEEEQDWEDEDEEPPPSKKKASKMPAAEAKSKSGAKPKKTGK